MFDLNASGPKGFLAVEYSREFSRHKIDLGIPEDIVFHSFRHNVETLLGSKPLKQEWIDVMMGHKFEKKGQARKSIGVLIYLHGLEMSVLQQTAYAVEYPAHLCPTLLLRRLRGEVALDQRDACRQPFIRPPAAMIVPAIRSGPWPQPRPPPSSSPFPL
nr:hypothetical protein [uncultured Rhodopila sp.]